MSSYADALLQPRKFKANCYQVHRRAEKKGISMSPVTVSLCILYSLLASQKRFLSPERKCQEGVGTLDICIQIWQQSTSMLGLMMVLKTILSSLCNTYDSTTGGSNAGIFKYGQIRDHVLLAITPCLKQIIAVVTRYDHITRANLQMEANERNSRHYTNCDPENPTLNKFL